MTRWSPLHKMIHAMPGGDALARAGRRLSLIMAVSDALTSRTLVPALTPNEAEAVLQHWAASNARLVSRLPNLADDLRAAGYVRGLRVVGA